MAEYAGSALYMKFGSTVLSSDYRSMTLHEESGIIDASAGSDTYRNKIAILTDATAQAELLMQAGGTALSDAIAPQTSATLEVGPEGTASGKERIYGVAIVKTRERGFQFDDVSVINVEWEFNGTVTHTVY